MRQRSVGVLHECRQKMTRHLVSEVTFVIRDFCLFKYFPEHFHIKYPFPYFIRDHKRFHRALREVDLMQYIRLTASSLRVRQVSRQMPKYSIPTRSSYQSWSRQNTCIVFQVASLGNPGSVQVPDSNTATQQLLAQLIDYLSS